ncbi:M14 family zinc carboxypeptidase [Noviluteimonas gilva]|uniref:Peptidase M14 n=1 Tax=Noviluteimonas gilva TaxID=2682097 RepID=A0A7C9LN17_9GAMM|nr:M14 family zinc carboxypeptidase [Lysobacter gilvus]MUV15484.1 peptidase M14 [Lysobacter gilvus]
MPLRPRRIVLARAVAAALLVLPVCWLAATAATPSATSTFRNDPDRLVFVTVHWRDRAQLQRIAANFQHLIIDEKARTARTEASAADLATLRRLGVRVDIDDASTERMRRAESALAERETLSQRGLSGAALRAEESIPGFSCYRTVEETYATINSMAYYKPNLAKQFDIGPTWQWKNSGGATGYRIKVLRLNNTATDARIPNKRNMVVLAAIHAREYTTAELTTRFAEWLVNGYGTDADATWLMDNFRFHFILQANPDGRKKAESGLSWRKNVDTANGTCSANAYGIDLNRNFPWRFGQVPNGSSGDPCAATYRGPSSMSEPETQALMRYIVGTPNSQGVYEGGVLPDLRTDTGVAPTTYPGLFLDIHSFSQLVLWPWANTSASAPNMTDLRTLGRRLAYFNGYRPVQWIGMYPADGTNTDAVYGATGAPSYTIELGQSFFEDCATFESSTYPRNLEALKYAARTLNAPYTYAGGPDTTSVGAAATTITAGQEFAVAGWFDDSRYNQNNGTEGVQAIAHATAYLDGVPWAGGVRSFAMIPSDGVFNTSRERAYVNIPTGGLAKGMHTVYMRAVDASGRAGTAKAIRFRVQ